MPEIKILHIDTEKTWRGGERQVLLLAQGLQNLGVDQLLVVSKGAPLEVKAREGKVPTFSVKKVRGEIDLFVALKLASIVRKRKINIIHAHTSHAHSLAMLTKWLTRNKPKVIVTRRVDFTPFQKSSCKMFTKLKYRFGADHFIAISEKIKEILTTAGVPKEKVSVVYSGVDPGDVINGDGSKLRKVYGVKDEAVIGNISYFAAHKAHEDLLFAFNEVLQRGHSARLFLAGTGEREGYLRHLVRQLGLEGHVVFLGFREDIADLLSFFDLFVVSSREEGLCSSIIDAFFAGCPVVATDAGGIPELVKPGETGILAKRGNPSSLAQAILYALEHREEMVRMAMRARELAYSKFTAEAMVHGNLGVYSKVLGSSPGWT